MATEAQFKEDLSLFVEIGLIAIKQGDEESAKKIFNAIGVLDPKNLARKMGYGLIALHKMDIKSAQKSFQEILQQEEQNSRAKAFLALSHILSVFQGGASRQQNLQALQQGAQLAEEVLAQSEEASTRQLAQSLLDWEKALETRAEIKN